MNFPSRIVSILSLAAYMFSGALSTARSQTVVLTDVNIVAHHDDDSFFMQPDIYNSYLSGHAQVTVFVTGGNVLIDDLYYMHQREQGAIDAYGAMAQCAAGIPLSTPPSFVHWNIAIRNYGGVKATVANCVEYPKLHLIFLRCPASKSEDGNNADRDLAGNFRQPAFNLRDLYNHPTYSQLSVDGAAVFNKAKMTSALTAVLLTWKPVIIRSQDVLNSHPVDAPNAYTDQWGYFYDHSDHYWGAKFVYDAVSSYHKKTIAAIFTFFAYRGYNIYNDNNILLDDSFVQLKRWLGFYYSQNDFHFHQTGAGSPNSAYSIPSIYTFGDWLLNINDIYTDSAFGPGGWMHHQGPQEITHP